MLRSVCCCADVGKSKHAQIIDGVDDLDCIHASERVNLDHTNAVITKVLICDMFDVCYRREAVLLKCHELIVSCSQIPVHKCRPGIDIVVVEPLLHLPVTLSLILMAGWVSMSFT